MNRQTIYDLIKKDKEGTATASEKQALAKWYNSVSNQEAEFPEDEERVREEMLARLMSEINFPKTRSFNYQKWAVAASVLIMLTAGLIVFNAKYKESKKQGAALSQNIQPGSNKAILTLANGTKVRLADISNGKILQQGGSRVIKTTDGKLIYDAGSGVPANDALQYNTMETPKGGQYQLLLPDGTRVWLNAATSLKYPVSFALSKERVVELNGEAYFEVAHDKAHPFRVVSNKQSVEVLGTHFNVNAYPDEPNTKTTLLEGSVKVTSGNDKAILKPNQESDLTTNFKISDVDAQEAISWKNGDFRFDEEPLEIVMRQIARWYDVKVVFEDESVKKETLVAVTKRFDSIAKLLKIIEQTTDARFIIEGSTIRVAKHK
ncbi:FecR domain-containing protein [Mucilaginibacter sabulilitoris]|uniref:FecR domain-containing protein n=1 Tax=Mucilaginibacter sabulilitoris TaxID=1173583 RepID=A0ABZ0TLN3_9SPHI|nr:FecR domain-containing protein [Mucilaginibacter sabulilitoris]WPU92450.1 FecR domain-containing protein [Mucilaginibacter sabulilitoris]